MSEMVDRLARQIESKSNYVISEHHAKALARSLLEVMKVPTEAMVRAGTVSWDPMDGSPIRPIFEPTLPYQAMIEEALK